MGFLENFHIQVLGNGSGPKLVFLHGLMGSGANWRKVVPAFRKDYHILLLDQRGHGRSFHPSHGYSPEDYARDLEKVLDELCWTEKIYLVGHSMGGRNALSFAYQFPYRIRCLVIEDIGPDSHPNAVGKIELYLNSVPTPFANKGKAKQFFDEKFPQMVGCDRLLAQYLYTNIEVRENGQADWRFSRQGILASVREGRAYERWDQVRGLQVPTLVVRGKQSEELSFEVYQHMMESNSLVSGVQIEQAGHWVHFDQPQDFIDSLQTFFAQVE